MRNVQMIDRYNMTYLEMFRELSSMPRPMKGDKKEERERKTVDRLRFMREHTCWEDFVLESFLAIQEKMASRVLRPIDPEKKNLPDELSAKTVCWGFKNTIKNHQNYIIYDSVVFQESLLKTIASYAGFENDPPIPFGACLHTNYKFGLKQLYNKEKYDRLLEDDRIESVTGGMGGVGMDKLKAINSLIGLIREREDRGVIHGAKKEEQISVLKGILRNQMPTQEKRIQLEQDLELIWRLYDAFSMDSLNRSIGEEDSAAEMGELTGDAAAENRMDHVLGQLTLEKIVSDTILFLKDGGFWPEKMKKKQEQFRLFLTHDILRELKLTEDGMPYPKRPAGDPEVYEMMEGTGDRLCKQVFEMGYVIWCLEDGRIDGFRDVYEYLLREGIRLQDQDLGAYCGVTKSAISKRRDGYLELREQFVEIHKDYLETSGE